MSLLGHGLCSGWVMNSPVTFFGSDQEVTDPALRSREALNALEFSNRSVRAPTLTSCGISDKLLNSTPVSSTPKC